MRTLLVARADPASVNLRDSLLALGGWSETTAFQGLPVREGHGVRLVEIEGMHLDADDLDRELAAADLPADEGIIVLSKHKAASGSPALTAHPIGNYGDADFGGRPRRLTATLPRFMAECLAAMHRRVKATPGVKHRVSYEATHHGPTLGVPACFVEIGTREDHWEDPVLGDLVAGAVLEALAAEARNDAPVLLGIGGSHYAPRMTDLARRGQAAFGHLIPAYQLEGGLDPEVVLQAVEGTPGIQGYYMDDRQDLPKGTDDVLHVLGGLDLGRWTDAELQA